MSATATAHSQAKEGIQTLLDNLPAPDNTSARDWAGFFAALSKFIAAILPLILPLFTTHDEPN